MNIGDECRGVKRKEKGSCVNIRHMGMKRREKDGCVNSGDMARSVRSVERGKYHMKIHRLPWGV